MLKKLGQGLVKGIDAVLNALKSEYTTHIGVLLAGASFLSLKGDLLGSVLHNPPLGTTVSEYCALAGGVLAATGGGTSYAEKAQSLLRGGQ